MPTTRRAFLSRLAAAPLAFSGLRASLERDLWGRMCGLDGDPGEPGFGPLVADPDGLLDLPAGFAYRVISRAGERMDDGLLVPAAHDGMAAFAGPDGATILVRNHEIALADPERGAFGPGDAWQRYAELDRLRDAGDGSGPALGGTTTVVYDPEHERVLRHYLSLGGTARNCAGGPTPWGSWITCEEYVLRAGEGGHAVDHGYCFDVPARAAARPVEPVPLVAMGRFNHEAIAVDPRTGIVYQTEDRGDSLFYRFLPRRVGRLHDGGTLQALVLADRLAADTRNWSSADRIPQGARLRARWVTLEDVAAPEDDLRVQGYREKDCALFARGEGMWWGADGAYFTCTIGGRTKKGQIWRYVPDAPDRDRPLDESGGALELFCEPNDQKVLDHCDNLTVTPWGDLIVCEDGPAEQFLVGVTPDGACYPFARNAKSTSELAGACFAPDGKTLFANVQHDGITVAITGPFRAGSDRRR